MYPRGLCGMFEHGHMFSVLCWASSVTRLAQAETDEAVFCPQTGVVSQRVGSLRCENLPSFRPLSSQSRQNQQEKLR